MMASAPVLSGEGEVADGVRNVMARSMARGAMRLHPAEMQRGGWTCSGCRGTSGDGVDADSLRRRASQWRQRMRQRERGREEQKRGGGSTGGRRNR
jgi:hypothetical protein